MLRKHLRAVVLCAILWRKSDRRSGCLIVKAVTIGRDTIDNVEVDVGRLVMGVLSKYLAKFSFLTTEENHL